MSRTGTTFNYTFGTTFGAPQQQQVQLGFVSEITSAYDASTGYSWKRLWLDPATLTFADPEQLWEGNMAFHPLGITDLPVGTLCWQEVEGGSRAGYVLIPFADYPPDPALTVAGADGSPSYADTLTLQFDEADGFVITQPGANTVRVDLTPTLVVREVDGSPSVSAVGTIEFDQGDGFVVSTPGSGVARIDLNLGCGLTVTGGAVVVNSTTLAGTAATTGLVTSGTCGLGVDFTVTSTVVVREVVSDVETFDCCTVTRTVTARNVTFGKNAAGDVVAVTQGATADTVTTYDLCARVACAIAANTDPLVAAGEADPFAGIAPLTVAFAATPTGGVPPYTYLWTFPDSSTSTSATPSYEFLTPGLYLVKLDVTDSCGCTDTVYIPVAVGDECECETCLEDSPPGTPDYLELVLGSGTGDFAPTNGTWRLYPIGGCEYAWYQNGFVMETVATTNGSPWTMTVYNHNPPSLTPTITAGYEGTSVGCCDGATGMTLDNSTGTGTPAVFTEPSDPIVGTGCNDCPPVCPNGYTYTTATITDPTGGCGCLVGGMNYNGTPGGTCVAEWVTNSCPGNPAYQLHCIDGILRFFVGGTGGPEGVYLGGAPSAPSWRIEPGANCGSPGDQATVTVTS